VDTGGCLARGPAALPTAAGPVERGPVERGRVERGPIEPGGAERSGAGRGRGERAGLTGAAILAAARAVVEGDGVERLTMRRLAAELGVTPNSLYSHFESKAALVDALLDSLLADVEAPDPDAGDWRDGLVALMGSTRRVLLAHPRLVALFLARPGRGANAMRLGDATLRLLARGGVRGPRAAQALRALLVFSLGFAAVEVPRRGDPAGDERLRRSRDAFQSAPAELTAIRAAAGDLARHPDDEDFELALRWLMAGIEHGAAGPRE
jgi:TetR/AcrR family transcriptional regulator, tetracycline repressor protein